MGEVWKARDTRLDRTVAIKVLPPNLTSDPAARQRFEREARAVAALSHPHICPLFDIGHQDGTDYLVMEFLEGRRSRSGSRAGSCPSTNASSYGIQIADGVAAAHQAGIVHRDLKPGNIMLTKSGATLLDFGLAKPAVPMVGAGFTQGATHEALTGAGTLVGTLQYMAPEQLQGLPADERTDVFAFGCVVYEMVTGRPAFAGATPASVIAAILEREPGPMAVGSEPIALPVLDGIIRTCLAKNPADRWSSGHDVFVALGRLGRVGEPSQAAGASRAPSRRSALAWGIAALLFATTVAALYRPDRRPAETLAAPTLKSLVEFPNTWLSAPTLSPDGRYLSMFAYQGGQEGRTLLIRRLADGEVTWLGTGQGAPAAAWSPDSRSLTVIADGELKAVDVATGGIRTIGRVQTGGFWSSAWNRDGIILLGGSRLQRMSVADGHVTDVYAPGAEITSQAFPSFLPDGRTFLYAQQSSHAQQRGVFLGSLDSPSVTRVLPEPANAVFSSRGYLLYGRLGTLFAQRFDLDQKRVVGEPLGIGSDVMSSGTFTAFAVADHMLVWSNGIGTPPARLTWFDRNGKTLSTTPEARPVLRD